MNVRLAVVVCATFFAGLATARAADEARKADPKPAAEATARIEQELVRNTDVQYLDTQLADVVTDLELRHKIDIELDTTALAAEGMGPETPVNKTISNMPLSGALNHLLRDKHLVWYVHDGLLTITTDQAARAITETKVYSVAGLVDAANAAAAPEPAPPVDDRVTRYADGMIKQYDKNGNGVLDGDELSGIKGASQKADRDGDGRITTEELAAYLSSYGRSRSGLAAPVARDYDAIEKVIDTTVFRAAGANVRRTIRSHRSTKTIVVAADPIEQREVAKLIGELHEAAKYEGVSRVLPLPTEAEAKIDKVLAGTTQMQYLDTQLGDVRNDLERRYGIYIELDEEGLKDVGGGTGRSAESPVTYLCKNTAFGAALDSALAPLGLTWTRDEVALIITSKLFEPSFRTRKLYRVDDLATSAEEYAELESLIRDTVARETWYDERAAKGPEPKIPGYGEIAPLASAGVLVVTQTPRTHRAIEKLLDDLRGARKGK
jgi:hypothetical protein